MVKRSVCLCDNELIGIETIYTVVGGKQINEPERLKEVREKSNNNELFCSCGCGKNVILVAGDKNLRKQHFRLKGSMDNEECTYVSEGVASVYSKIVLKCWLDDKLITKDVQSRVPIYEVGDVNRKYEFSFLSRNKGIAVSYCYNRANLSDEKIRILENNGNNIHITFIVDISNSGCNGQYPESLMKVQEKQGYCLLLDADGMEYDSSKMKAICYAKNIYGLWEELVIAEGAIDDFSIDDNGNIIYRCAELSVLKDITLSKFNTKNEEEQKQIALELEKRQFDEIRIYEEEQERKRQHEEYMRKMKEEKAEKERLRREKIEKAQIEKKQREEDFNKNITSEIVQHKTLVFDGEGKRWLNCDYCKKWKTQKDFVSYGGKNHMNGGTCYECDKTNPNAKMYKTYAEKSQKIVPKSKCPKCGGMLKERNGKYGLFLGCSNYPKCDFTVKKTNLYNI
ncbi:MAG: DNA topoisomerase I [Lachnospiraceae bacterium]|nr:DNA topoisomerase I [Lachnospiraceae bacterium]